jgi:hypothetical protein
MQLKGDRYRVYFHGRDKDNRSQPGYFEIDITRPTETLYLSPDPVLKVGNVGLFDDAGILGPWIVNDRGLLFMYYSGWSRGLSVPYYSAIGLAISKNGGRTFKKYSIAPIVDRCDVDPYMTISGCVLREKSLWRMWYCSAKDFRVESGKPMYCYHIKYAESADGVDWTRSGHVCIDFRYNGETRIGAPCVIKEEQLYKMWYCFATDRYRIGYAESEDGIHWIRKDEEAGIDVSESGWDSEMVCYPYVFEHKGRKYMLYNGNGYGKSGLGYAVLEKE